MQQIIEDRYLDDIRLELLLASKFAPGTYSLSAG